MYNGISVINIHSIRRRSAYGKDAPFLDTVNYLLLVVEYFLYIAVSVDNNYEIYWENPHAMRANTIQNRNKPASI